MLPILIFQMKGIKGTDKGYYREHIPKEPTKRVNPAEDEFVIQETDSPVDAFWDTGNDEEANDRQK